MVETEKVLVSIRDAMDKRPRKVKASFKSNSDKHSESNKRISFLKVYKRKLRDKLNRKTDEPSP